MTDNPLHTAIWQSGCRNIGYAIGGAPPANHKRFAPMQSLLHCNSALPLLHRDKAQLPLSRIDLARAGDLLFWIHL